MIRAAWRTRRHKTSTTALKIMLTNTGSRNVEYVLPGDHTEMIQGRERAKYRAEISMSARRPERLMLPRQISWPNEPTRRAKTQSHSW